MFAKYIIANFLASKDGNVFGHFETIKGEKDRLVRIEKLGCEKSAPKISSVDVVWTARNPSGGRRVVGWYRNAEVYRERQHFVGHPSTQHKRDDVTSFRIKALFEDATLLPIAARDLKLGKGPSWIGQANWWYPELESDPAVHEFLRRVRHLMDSHQASGNGEKPTKKSGWGGDADVERKALVESAAIATVASHFDQYEIKSVEKDNVGWDLEALDGDQVVLRLEVKGLFGSELKIGVTPREFKAFNSHACGGMADYRLCVLTSALTDTPKLTIFKHDGQRWKNEVDGVSIVPNIDILEAAIISL